MSEDTRIEQINRNIFPTFLVPVARATKEYSYLHDKKLNVKYVY